MVTREKTCMVVVSRLYETFNVGLNGSTELCLFNSLNKDNSRMTFQAVFLMPFEHL